MIVEEPVLQPLDRAGDLPPRDADGLSKGQAFLDHFLKGERRIFAYIFTLMPNRTDAEDVLQEVSKMLWERFDEVTPPADFVAWACRIAYYKIMAHRRGQRRQRVVYSDAMVERVAQTILEHADDLRIADRLEALNGCLQKLGRGDRALVAQRFKTGATAQSAAQSVGRSVDSVYKELARIRRLLHACVDRQLRLEG